MSDQLTQAARTALQAFASVVAERLGANVHGEPEDQLRGPFETLLREVGETTGRHVVTKSETQTAHGKPDYAVVVDGALAGYAELKAPGKGVSPSAFTGHDQEQWKRFKSLPNLLYTDGNTWAMFRGGSRAGPAVALPSDLRGGDCAIDEHSARALGRLLLTFMSWDPIVPGTAREVAELVAPICRLLREEVSDALAGQARGSSLSRLAADWRELLFPNADDSQFADAYAQTVTYALLLARAEGVVTLDAGTAAAQLEGEFGLLGRALQVLTDAGVRAELSASLPLLERLIAAVDSSVFKAVKADPWLYFYEDFLAAYDPKLRKDAGVYYTPIPVVGAQVRIADDLLRKRLSRDHGLADEEVLTLDPAVGTGTYLLATIDHTLRRVLEDQGPGSVPARATVLARNLHGFELMVGPYAVAQLRVARDLRERGAEAGSPNIFLTDTLEHPSTEPKAPPLFYEPIAADHRRAQEIKDKAPILVCIGNPPYDRHDADSPLGGWVRFGAQDEVPLLEDFLAPAREAGHGVHLKNLYNLYVYFWRWAIWKVFEHTSGSGPGIVSFITASSYLAGPGFSGMRELLRRECDEVWILDLGGEGRGARRDENVFAIQTPVAIAVAARYDQPDRQVPAAVRYTRISGSRAEKLGALDAIDRVDNVEWNDCPSGWHDPFRPAGVGPYFDWPELTALLPWQHSGVEAKRIWPIGATQETLRKRWHKLLKGNRAQLFRETGDRTVKGLYSSTPSLTSGPPLAELDMDAEPPPVERYAYRSFDRQFLLADIRLLSRPRPLLWHAHSNRQVYLTTLLTDPVGGGPAITACASVPDRHHFRGSFGGKTTVPLWRDAAASEANVTPGLLDALGDAYGRDVGAEGLLAYVYAVLACPAYTARFEVELEEPGPRVPITREPKLFAAAVEVGSRLLWLHTYGERFTGEGRPAGQVPRGKARWTRPVPEDAERYPRDFAYDEEASELRVGEGMVAPVARAVYEYDVSGLRIVQSWLGYRMPERAGRSSSPLDQIQPERWTAELNVGLLELLWTLEHTLTLHPKQEALLSEIVAGPTFTASELPEPTAESMRASAAEDSRQLGLG